MSTNLHVMGNRIRTARQFRRLTGEQLAEKLGIAVDSLRHIENGVRRPSYQLLDDISDILDVSLDYLAGKTEAPLERRIRKELEGAGLTKAQDAARKASFYPGCEQVDSKTVRYQCVNWMDALCFFAFCL